MARRRSRRRLGRSKPPNLWVIFGQILLLLVLLIGVLAITDTIGEGTSGLVEALTGDDLEVRESAAEDDKVLPAESTDDVVIDFDEDDKGTDNDSESEDIDVEADVQNQKIDSTKPDVDE